jgi:hypothetical protein
MLEALPSPPLTPAQIETIHALFATVRTSLDLPTAVLAHGDFRFKNVLLEGGRVSAVLDFEMALAGDPALDLAWLLHSDSAGESDQEALFRGYLAEAREGIGAELPGGWRGTDYVTPSSSCGGRPALGKQNRRCGGLRGASRRWRENYAS